MRKLRPKRCNFLFCRLCIPSSGEAVLPTLTLNELSFKYTIVGIGSRLANQSICAWTLTGPQGET